MKYLRKIFESTKEDQLEDIESVFTEYIDQKYTAEDGEEYSTCNLFTDESDQYVMVNIESYLEGASIASLTEFDKIYAERSEYLNLLKRIRVTLLRLEKMGYDWAMDFDNEGFHIKVFYKDTQLTLADCFGGEKRMRHVDEPIIKKYMNQHYNLEFSSYVSRQETKGYYGKRAELIIYFRSPVPDQLIDDLKKLEKNSEVWGSISGKQTKVEKAFYQVERLTGAYGVKIELN